MFLDDGKDEFLADGKGTFLCRLFLSSLTAKMVWLTAKTLTSVLLKADGKATFAAILFAV